MSIILSSAVKIPDFLCSFPEHSPSFSCKNTPWTFQIYSQRFALPYGCPVHKHSIFKFLLALMLESVKYEEHIRSIRKADLSFRWDWYISHILLVLLAGWMFKRAPTYTRNVGLQNSEQVFEMSYRSKWTSFPKYLIRHNNITFLSLNVEQLQISSFGLS